MRSVALAFTLLLAAVAAQAARARPPGIARPMPSHTPRATQRLWTQLVHRRRRERKPEDTSCRPLRAVFYTEDDWLRLATKLAADASPCAQYYISIPPLAADKTTFRSDQAWRIRALGPSFHPVAEINYTGWSKWVAANGSTFYEAGVEARRRMAAAGFDVSAGDTWALNELSSAVRAGTNVARQKARDLVRGLYTGDGTEPPVKGIVFDIGIDQSTPDLAPYKVALQGWFEDAAFWEDMSSYVGDWSQELYGDVRDEAVAGASVPERIEHLNDFLAHEPALASAGPADAAAAASFLRQAYSPLANAAWMWDSGFGYTDVPLAQMEDYVSAQVAALRSYDAAAGLESDHFGFAWAPRMPDGSAWTAQFTSDSGALIDRLAAAIHDSDSSPTGACGATWCTAGLAGAAFTDAWKTFGTWSPPALALAAPSGTIAAGAASGPFTVQLETDGIPQPALAPTSVTVASSSSSGSFSATPNGPWTSELTLTVPAGTSSGTFYSSDTQAGTATVTATSDGRAPASETETIVEPPPPPQPPAAAQTGGGALPPDLHVQLTSAAAVAPPVGSQLVYEVAVTTTGGSASSVRLVLALPAGYAVAETYADRGPGCTGSSPVLTCDVAWISPGTGTHVTVWGTVTAPGELDATATATSLVEPQADPADGTSTLRLVAPAVPLVPVVRAAAAAKAVRRPTLAGRMRVGATIHAVAARWSARPSRVTYAWQLCRRRACTPIRGATRRALRLRPAYARRRVRVVATATIGGVRVASASRAALVRRR